MAKKQKQKNNIWRNMLPEDLALLWIHILHWVHEGESWEGLAGCTALAPVIHRGGDRLKCELWVNVADITGTSLERSEEWTHAVHWYKKVFSTPSWTTLTTFGMNGGLTFLAKRLFQLMDAKKECSCSSTWIHTEIRPSVVRCVYVHHCPLYTYKVMAPP